MFFLSRIVAFLGLAFTTLAQTSSNSTVSDVPTFFVNSPGISQVYKVRDVIPIRWFHNASPIPQSLSVDLALGRQGPIVTNIASGLSYRDGTTWVIPADTNSGYYSIRLSGTSANRTVTGRSATFIINGVGSLPKAETISIVAPTAGTVWEFSKPQLFGWAFTKDTFITPTRMLITVFSANATTDIQPITATNATGSFYYRTDITGTKVNATGYTPGVTVKEGQYIAKFECVYDDDANFEQGMCGEAFSGVFSIVDKVTSKESSASPLLSSVWVAPFLSFVFGIVLLL